MTRKMEAPELLGALLWLRNQYDIGSVPPARSQVYTADHKRMVLAVIDAVLQADGTEIDFKGFREDFLPSLKVIPYEDM
jgi:hypothetical protein